jgi:hypothetical protein
MMKLNRYFIIPLLLVIVALLLVPGCKEKEETEPTATPTATDELSQEQMQQILADTITSTLNVYTYKFEMSMTTDMETTGGTQAGKLNMVMNVSGAYDQTNKNMQMTMDMNMESDFPEFEEEMQDMSVEMYMVEESMYMKMDMPMVGEQWLKMPVSEEMTEAYNSDMVGDQLKMLEGAGKIEFLRYEVVDGADCYVFKLVPDMQKIMDWVGQQPVTGAELDSGSISNIADVFKDLTYTIWIARDSKLTQKMDANILMEFNAEQYGAESGEFDGMRMNMVMGMRMYNYNKPVSIILPEEAEDAIDMSEMGGLGQ